MRDPMLPTYVEVMFFVLCCVCVIFGIMAHEIRSELRKSKIRQRQILARYFRDHDVTELRSWKQQKRRRL